MKTTLTAAALTALILAVLGAFVALQDWWYEEGMAQDVVKSVLLIAFVFTAVLVGLQQN